MSGAAGETGSPLRVRVDRDRCEANGLCVELAPEVFALGDDDVLRIRMDEPPEVLREAVAAAVRSCPKQALTLEGGQSVAPAGPRPGEFFLGDMGFELRMDPATGTGRGELPVVDALRVGDTGFVRASVLATLADVLVGMLATHVVQHTLMVTSDLVTRCFRPETADRLLLSARLLKGTGRTLVGECSFHEPGVDRPSAHATLTFLGLPTPHEVPSMGTVFATGASRLDRSFPDQVGASVVAPGVAEVERSSYVTHGGGTIQGGIMALVAELAAESLLGASGADGSGHPASAPGGTGVVTELEVRYLSAVRKGPARAHATLLDTGVVRVEVVDVGAADRLAALVIATGRRY